MTWNQITNEIVKQRRIELAALRRRVQLEEERRKLEIRMLETRKQHGRRS